MKVHILDDWFDTLRTLPSYSLLENHDVTIWTDHVEDVKELSTFGYTLNSSRRTQFCINAGLGETNSSTDELTKIWQLANGCWTNAVRKNAWSLWLWANRETGCQVCRRFPDGENVASSRESFFESSDFISLHVRLKPNTKGIITSDDLNRMKKSATFVNTSRSGLVEAGALEKSVQSGRPGRLALDVFDVEPFHNTDDPVINHPTVISTPHVGYVTEDELNMQFTDIYEQINAFSDGFPIHMINETVFSA